VRSTYADSSNQLVAYMRGKDSAQYDLVSASSDVSRLLVDHRDVAALDLGLVPGWADVAAPFRSLPAHTVGGKHYGIPLHWVPNLLLYNTRQIKPAPVSWGALYDRRHKGRVTVPNNPMQIADAALYMMRAKPALGIHDPYELTKPQFNAAVALLKAQKKLVDRYWNYPADELQDFKNGRVTIGSGWPWQVETLRTAKVPVAEAKPKEGVTGWIDTWMLGAKAKHPNCAYRWLRYVTTPAVQAQIAVAYGAAPVVPKACPLMNRRHPGSCAGLHANAAPAYLRSIRFWKTPLADCGFGGRMDCVGFVAWQTAWAGIVR
jgi:putative spermidine/putrescine transport system substrate-binding protein